jgi:hypothetical protein
MASGGLESKLNRLLQYVPLWAARPQNRPILERKFDAR